MKRLILLLILNLFTANLFAKKITIAKGDKHEGVHTKNIEEYLKNAYKSIGHDVEFVSLPLKRMYFDFEEGKFDSFFMAVDKALPEKVAVKIPISLMKIRLEKFCLAIKCDSIRKKDPHTLKGVSTRGAKFLKLIPEEEFNRLHLVDSLG